MMEQGALDEVLQLKALDLDPTLPLMTALGVRPLLRHLAGELSRDAAVAAGQAETRQLRKTAGHVGARQYDCVESIDTQEMEISVADFISFIQAHH